MRDTHCDGARGPRAYKLRSICLPFCLRVFLFFGLTELEKKGIIGYTLKA